MIQSKPINNYQKIKKRDEVIINNTLIISFHQL